MNNYRFRLLTSTLIFMLLTSFFLTGCGSPQTESSPPAAQEQSAPATQVQNAPVALDGASLLQERCTVCHDLGRVEQAKKSADEWKATVTRIVGKGAKLDQAEQEAVIQFLAQTYPK